MSRPYLRLVVNADGLVRPCDCQPWASLRDVDRDLTLYDFMRWAHAFHEVELMLLARGSRVAVCQVFSIQPGRGHTRRVLAELCTWADCAGVALALTPTGQWGADVGRLTRFYVSLGFEDNTEPPPRFQVQEKMIRFPVEGGGHKR